MESVIH